MILMVCGPLSPIIWVLGPLGLDMDQDLVFRALRPGVIENWDILASSGVCGDYELGLCESLLGIR